MEEGVFPLPRIAEELRSRFVEARLFLDAPKQNYDENHALKRRYSGTETTPVYVLVDPVTGEALARQEGASSEETFLAFLRSAASDRSGD